LQPTGDTLNQPGGLAERLKRLRKDAGLTGAQLAANLGWKSRTRVPKLERGQQMPNEDDITRWAQACGHPEEIPELLGLLAEAGAVHEQWRHKLRRGHAALQAEFDKLVRDAKRIRNFEVMVIPGLLQTADYARYRVLEAVRVHGFAESEVEKAVTARMRRQEALYDAGKTFEFIVCESALRYLLCPPQVMAGQLDRLLTVSGLGNVTLGIIPPGVELDVAPMVGYLTVDDVTVVETFTSEDKFTGAESATYDRISAALMAEAVTGDEARRLITAAADSLREGR
jgi:transcriptional regulator with XRE-family HTH domain